MRICFVKERTPLSDQSLQGFASVSTNGGKS
jgi:hypothetical protein